MKRHFLGAGVLAALVLGLPAVAADKKAKATDKDANPADYQAILDAHTVTGKLTAVGGSDKSFALRVEYQVAQPNPHHKGSNATLARLLRDQNRVLRSRNPYQQAARLQQLQLDIFKEQAHEAGAVKFVTQSREFDLESTSNAVVRVLELPADYDDKGNLKKYTATELKELKGSNPDLPGYTSGFDKLLPGQTVRVSLVKPKADKDKDAATQDRKPQASMIVIVKDAPTDAPAAKEKKKKNK